MAVADVQRSFECPSCKAPESSDCKTFQHHDLDRNHQCLKCGKMNAVKVWKCECNVIWHTCRRHKFARAHDNLSNMQSKPKGPTPSASNPEERSNKVMKPNFALDRNEAETIETWIPKRGREEQPDGLINLGEIIHQDVSPRLLGPVLKRRFIYG